MTELEKLLDDTLHVRSINSEPGSCMTVNSTGLKLLKIEDDILREIELALEQVDVSIADGSAIPRGLNYVIGSYMLNGAKHGPVRVVEFLEDKNDAIIEQFLGNLAIFFKLTDTGPMYGEELPVEFADAVKRYASSDEGRLKEIAIRTKEKLNIE